MELRMAPKHISSSMPILELLKTALLFFITLQVLANPYVFASMEDYILLIVLMLIFCNNFTLLFFYLLCFSLFIFLMLKSFIVNCNCLFVFCVSCCYWCTLNCLCVLNKQISCGILATTLWRFTNNAFILWTRVSIRAIPPLSYNYDFSLAFQVFPYARWLVTADGVTGTQTKLKHSLSYCIILF